MVESVFISAVIESFWKLLIILDPFLGLAVFVTLTNGMSVKEKAKQALIATSVALALLLFFLFFGNFFLNLLGINLSSLRVAGGILLLILGIQAVLGLEFAKKSKKNTQAAAIIIGTPLLCGPGAITKTMILAETHGQFPVLIAIVVAMILTWIMLYFADAISKFTGEKLVEIISRVFGLFLAALAIDMISRGIIEMIKAFN